MIATVGALSGTPILRSCAQIKKSHESIHDDSIVQPQELKVVIAANTTPSAGSTFGDHRGPASPTPLGTCAQNRCTLKHKTNGGTAIQVNPMSY